MTENNSYDNYVIAFIYHLLLKFESYQWIFFPASLPDQGQTTEPCR